MVRTGSLKVLQHSLLLLLLLSCAHSKTLRGANDNKFGASTDIFTNVTTNGSVDSSSDIFTDSSTDAFTETSADALSEASSDSSTDSSTHSYTDEIAFMNTELLTDSSSDSATDAFLDASADAYADMAFEMSADTSMDISSDASLETSTHTSADAATDASMDEFRSFSDEHADQLHAMDESAEASSHASTESDEFADTSTGFSIDADISTEFPTARCTERPTLYIGISSVPTEESRTKRQLVRDTWMNYDYFQQSDCLQAKFFIGTNGLHPDVMEQLEEEKQLHDDMVFMPLEEGYDKLSNKTVCLLKWFAANTDARMVMKLDEDTFPHMRSIVSFLQHQSPNQKYLYMGSFLYDHPVLRTGKWAESDEYTSAFYPPFADGPGYLLSGDLVRKMAQEGFYNATTLLHNEDAHVGQMLSQIGDEGLVKRVEMKATQWGCNDGDLLSMQLGENHFKCMWELQQAGYDDDELCCGDYGGDSE